MIRLPSASALDRALACPPSLILPAVESPPGDAARKGSTVHQFLYEVMSRTSTRAEALARIPADDPGRALCEALDLDQLPQGGNLEVAFAWDSATGKGRVLGFDIGRDYETAGADRSREYVGSADFAGKRNDGKALVLDWKTGWATVAARDSWQLRGLGMMAAAAYGCSEAIVGHVYVRDEKPVFDLIELDEMEISAIRSELRQSRAQQAALAEAGADRVQLVREGAHCHFCPAFKSCPAKTALVRAMRDDLEKPEPTMTGLVTRENAALAARTLLRFEEIAKRMWAELEAIAAQEPIDLGDGRVFKLAPGRSSEQIKDAGQALGCLQSVCGDAAMNAAVTTTKAAIEEAARAWAVENGQPIGKTQAAVLNMAREIKAIEKKPGQMSVRIVKG